MKIGSAWMWMVMGLLMLPVKVTMAGTVVLVPSIYENGADTSGVSSGKLDTAVVAAIEEAGLVVLKGPAVLDTLSSMKQDAGRCDSDCLQALAARMEADEAIAVRASDLDQVQYTIDVTFAFRAPIHEERTAGFFVVLEWLKGAVALSLKSQPTTTSASSAGDTAPQTAGDGDTAETSSTTVVTPPEKVASAPPQSSRKKLNKTPFVATAALTGGLLVTFLILDGAVNKQYNVIKDEQSINSEVNYDDIAAAESLQSAEKVILGLTITSAIATGVLAIFTDFKGENATPPTPAVSTDAVSWRPVAGVSAKTGFVGLQGHF